MVFVVVHRVDRSVGARGAFLLMVMVVSVVNDHDCFKISSRAASFVDRMVSTGACTSSGLCGSVFWRFGGMGDQDSFGEMPRKWSRSNPSGHGDAMTGIGTCGGKYW